MAAAISKTGVMFFRILTPNYKQFGFLCNRNISGYIDWKGLSIKKPLLPKKLRLNASTSRTMCNIKNQRENDPKFVQDSEKDAKFVHDLKSSPSPALWLGFAGAIPFTGLAGLSIMTPEYMDLILHAQCGYGACILTFLGAIHWGYALSNDSQLKPDWRTLGYSVTPSLVAWSALLVKPQYGLVTIAIGLLYAFAKDLGTPCFPAWYHALRRVLTTVATSSVLLTTLTAYMYL